MSRHGPGVQALLVPQLAGGLDGLAELTSRGLAVEHVREEGVLERILTLESGW